MNETAPGPLVPRVARPSTAGALSASLTLGWRALLKIKHVPFQLFDVTAFPLMMTLLMTYIFGGALAGSPREYIQYLLPGIMVQTVLFITVYTGVGLNTDISKGLYDRFRSLPIWQPSPIAGALMGDVVRYGLAAAMVLALGIAIGFRPAGGPLGVLAALGLTLVLAFAVSWVWIIMGMVVKTPESVMTSSFLFMFPLVFVSDIYVDPATMPKVLQTLVAWNPVTHASAASRALMHGEPVGNDVLYVLVTSAIVFVVFAPIALRMYYRER